MKQLSIQKQIHMNIEIDVRQMDNLKDGIGQLTIRMPK